MCGSSRPCAPRANAAGLEADYRAARQAVLDMVREQLEAVDAAFAEQIQAAAAASTAAENEVRDLVLQLGRSLALAGIRAYYRNGAVTWNNEKMAAYARMHPEVLAFRKVGRPTVALRFADGMPSAKAAAESSATPREPEEPPQEPDTT